MTSPVRLIKPAGHDHDGKITAVHRCTVGQGACT
jgi:hypothetical protein